MRVSRWTPPESVSRTRVSGTCTWYTQVVHMLYSGFKTCTWWRGCREGFNNTKVWSVRGLISIYFMSILLTNCHKMVSDLTFLELLSRLSLYMLYTCCTVCTPLLSRVSPEHSTVAWGSAKQFVFPALGTLSLIWNMVVHDILMLYYVHMLYSAVHNALYTCCTVQWTHLEHEGDMTSPTEAGLPIRREHVRQTGLTCLFPRQS